MNKEQKRYSFYNPNRKRVQLEFNDKSRTKQSFKKECDINVIVKKAKSTSLPLDLITNTKKPVFGDFSSELTYQDSLNKIKEAEAQFNSLPSEVRKEFDNDPAKLLAFVSNEDNLPRAVELGLVAKDVVNKSTDNKSSSAPIAEKKTDLSVDPVVNNKEVVENNGKS